MQEGQRLSDLCTSLLAAAAACFSGKRMLQMSVIQGGTLLDGICSGAEQAGQRHECDRGAAL